MLRHQMPELDLQIRAPGLKPCSEKQVDLRCSTPKAAARLQPYAFHRGDQSVDRIRTIIADDEPLARRGIRQLVEAHADITVVAETRNGRETVTALRELRPELVFLDVQMPELDGFGVLKEIGSKHMPAVIFVTAYDEFAVRAFDAHALDYLVKPLEETRFADALQRMRDRLRSVKAFELSRKLSALFAKHEREGAKQRILPPTSAGDLVIDADEIDWIEADDYYAAIHARQRRHLIRESRASLEHRLG